MSNEPTVDRKQIASLLGRAGGNATFKKHGKKHYKMMLEKRWGKNKENKESSSETPSI